MSLFPAEGPDVDFARDTIERTWAARAARVLHAASTEGLYQWIVAAPATAEELSLALGVDADLSEKVMIVSAAMGLVERDARGWRLTEHGLACFDPSSPLYQGHAIAHSAQVEPVWHDLAPHLAGRQGWSRFVEGEGPPPRSHRDFILAMHNMAMAGRAAELARRVDLAGRRKLVDVGGGPGTYAMALVERYEGLEATVLDLPETVEIAREVIEALGFAGRVRTEAGDWNSASFGHNADAVLMSNILHGPGSEASMKLAKAHKALAPDGLLIVQDFLMNAEKTGPLKPALFNLMVGAFSLPELSAEIEAAGFTGLEAQPMPEDLGTTLVVAHRA